MRRTRTRRHPAALEHATDALYIDRDLVDPQIEGHAAVLVLGPAEPDARELRQNVGDLLPAVRRLGRRERRVRYTVPPELGLVRRAVVPPLDAHPLVGRHRPRPAVRIVIRVRPVAGPAVGAV